MLPPTRPTSTRPSLCLGLSSCQSLSRVRLFATSWTVALQAPLSMEFSRQEYWNVLSCPPLGDLPNPEIKPRTPALQADSLPSEPPGKLELDHRLFLESISLQIPAQH